MISIPEVNEYIDFVEKHPEQVNRERKLLVNLVKPVIANDKYYFDDDTYRKCIKYCEVNYYPLFPFQKFLYAFVFMYEDISMETTVFNLFLIVEGRGNGKDGVAMPLMNFLQTPLYGISHYNIDIVANSEEQATDSFNVVYDMLDDHKSKFKNAFYWNKEKIINLKTKSVLKYNTSNGKTKDGKRDGAIFFNEFHQYEDYSLVNVFTSGLGKIKHPRTFIVTTNGFVRDGPLDDYLTVSKQILESGDNELKYFPFICKIDSADELETDDVDKLENAFRKANPSMDYMPVLRDTIFKDYYEMKKIPSKKPEFMAKRMNLPAEKSESVVAKWNDILATTYEDVELKTPIKDDYDLENYPCIIGIDYADIRDFASAGLLFKIDGKYIWRQKTWICSKSPFFENIKFPFKNFGDPYYQDFEVVNTASIDASELVSWVYEQTQKYTCKRIIMDTYRFKLLRKEFESYGLSIYDPRHNPYGLVEMIRSVGSVDTIIAPIIEKAFTDHNINFGHSAIMRWFTNNTAVDVSKNGNKAFVKIEPKLRKNDGFMAFAMAIYREELLEEIVFEL